MFAAAVVVATAFVMSAGRGGSAGQLPELAEVVDVALLALTTGWLLPLCAALRSQGLGGEGFATEDIVVVFLMSFVCLEEAEPVLTEFNCRETKTSKIPS